MNETNKNILRHIVSGIGEPNDDVRDWEEILNRQEDNETLDKRRAEAEDADRSEIEALEVERELFGTDIR